MKNFLLNSLPPLFEDEILAKERLTPPNRPDKPSKTQWALSENFLAGEEGLWTVSLTLPPTRSRLQNAEESYPSKTSLLGNKGFLAKELRAQACSFAKRRGLPIQIVPARSLCSVARPVPEQLRAGEPRPAGGSMLHRPARGASCLASFQWFLGDSPV